jgi:plastocyanin
MTRSFVVRAVGLAALTAVVAACQSGASPANAPSPDPAVVIAITPGGASPRTITVKAGSQVTFTNNDTIAHQMYSDPHPEHTDCPEFDSVGYLAPGESRQTGNLNIVRTCGFHDHIHFENASLKGSIVIQP